MLSKLFAQRYQAAKGVGYFNTVVKNRPVNIATHDVVTPTDIAFGKGAITQNGHGNPVLTNGGPADFRPRIPTGEIPMYVSKLRG